MSDRKINPWLKLGLELGPIIAFFVAYWRLKEQVFTISGTEYSGFILVTAGFIPLLVVTSFILYRLTGHLSKMQVMTLLLVAVFGGLTIWLNDDRFFKMKPTILYLFFGSALGFGLLRGQSYLEYMMDGVMPLQREGWMIFTRRMCAFFFTLAVANELVWRFMSTDAWVTFKTFVLTGALFVFIMLQAKLFEKYGDEAEDKA